MCSGRPVTTRTLVAALVAAALTACSSSHHRAGADKAGGSSAPVVLRLAANTSLDQADARDVRYFAAQVAKLSQGKLRVRVVFEAAGRDAVFAEPQIARMVRAGKFDLGWVPTRAWDELGVDSLRPLQTPFLITSYALLDRVLRSSIGRRMARGIRAAGVIELALVPDLLQHPLGADKSLLKLDDYRGLRMRVHPSRAADALVRTLGARAVHVADVETLARQGFGKVDGLNTEFPEASSSPFIATSNVTFFPKVGTLFANRSAFARLGENERAALRAAAKRVVDRAAETRRSEEAFIREFCTSGGRVVTATRTDLVELERAAEPVTAELERDPMTRRPLDEIRALKRSTAPEPAPAVPSGCLPRRESASEGLPRRSPSIVNGTYRYTLTQAAADAFGPPITGHNEYPVVVTVSLRDGRWSLRTDELDTGMYTITGDRIAFRWPRVGYTNTFTFARGRDGTLHLKPVLPMDRGDQFVWAGAAWRRVGPPVKLTPP